jgi:hypothetical protein
MKADAPCPRCGYDLKGVVASWARSCPLAGRCSECGLELAWREVLGEGIALPRWYVECVPGRFVRRWAGTWVREAMPGRLWSGLDMRMRVRAGRLVSFVLMGMLATHVLMAVLAMGMQVRHHHEYVTRWAALAPGRPMPSVWQWLDWWAVAWPIGSMYFGDATVDVLLVGLIPVWIGLLMPTLCYLFSDTLRLEPMRQVHLVRIGLLWLPTALATSAVALAMAAEARTWWSSAPIVAVVCVTWVAWPIVFWWRAFERYLRLRRPLLATMLLFGVSSVLTGAMLVMYEVVNALARGWTQ